MEIIKLTNLILIIIYDFCNANSVLFPSLVDNLIQVLDSSLHQNVHFLESTKIPSNTLYVGINFPLEAN